MATNALHSSFVIRQSSFRRHRRQRGYIFLAILFMLALIMIAMVAVAPQIATQIRRDREDELIHRGNQYRIAIRRYFRKFGRYPAKIEDLENTNNTRFLRRRYKDPITGQDFKIIHYGEQKTQPHGFFGQPLANVSANQPTTITSPLMSGNQNNPQTPFGGNPPSIDNTTNPTGPSPNSPAPTGPNTGSPFGQTTFGGGAIIGVTSTSPKQSIHVINGKDHYNQWEFIYDPAQEVVAGAGGGVGAMPTSPGTSVNPGGMMTTPNQPTQPPPQQPPQQFPQ